MPGLPMEKIIIVVVEVLCIFNLANFNKECQSKYLFLNLRYLIN